MTPTVEYKSQIPDSKMSAIAASTPRISHFSPRIHQSRLDSSPNYFSLSLDSSKSSCQSSAGGAHARANFSPPSSRVRSTAAASPKVLPLDQNPEFDAFKRQTDLRGFANMQSFALPSSQSTGQISPPTSASPRSPKRSLPSPFLDITDRPRRHSPAAFTDRELQAAINISPNASYSLPPLGSPTSITSLITPKSDSLPVPASSDPFVSPSHVASILDAYEDQILLLDLRVSTHFARSCIQGSLNLCLPTTLLKRPMYNTQKLSETFKSSSSQRRKFEQWRSYRYIIVYDSSSSKMKDANACFTMLKKFTDEGWKGTSSIIRGGFHDFAKQFPNLIHHNAGSSSGTDSDSPARVAPVLGGCPMPATKSAANPFFSNIRQNMDLIGGVGQIAPKRPRSMSRAKIESVPKWLKKATEESNQGKLVADKFLQLEKDEQARLQQALSEKVIYVDQNKQKVDKISLAGLEKGSKNRYNNIWPYEHSRVKLENGPNSACDYINANYIQSSMSTKRYIATQAPIPATFTDFWNLVWQQDVRVILMLTAESEGGQLKAHNYWKDRRHGPVHLNFLSESRASLDPATIQRHRQRRSMNNSDMSLKNDQKPEPIPEDAYVIVRKFTLSHDDEPFARMREITHLQYANWPDFGAPAEASHVLGLVEQTNSVLKASQNASLEEETSPILVHCSAGCGRTGTFCTVDSVLDILKHHNFPADMDLVAKVVREYRTQRLSMVQSLRQFVLCYESVLEWITKSATTQ